MSACGLPHLAKRRLCSVWLSRTTAIALALSLQSALAADSWLVAMANPAAVACKEAGGTISKIYTDKGEQGMCTLPSGAACEEWAFFKGACGQDKPLQTQPATQTDKPASSPADKN
jgi:putative hemolysin